MKRTALKYLDSRPIRLDLNIQPMAEVLSPRARRQGNSCCSFSSIISRILTAIPRNSRTLFAASSPLKDHSLPTLTRQARPLSVYPPSPKGQESDQAMAVGVLIVNRFIEIPSLAAPRKCFQSSRSSISSWFNLTFLFLANGRRSIFSRRGLIKCRLRGIR